jgi:hypothetical protein
VQAMVGGGGSGCMGSRGRGRIQGSHEEQKEPQVAEKARTYGVGGIEHAGGVREAEGARYSAEGSHRVLTLSPL